MTIFENDRALLDAFRRGERAALTRVYEAYVDDVALLARRGFTIASRGLFIPGAPNADREAELVQETFVRAFGEGARTRYDGLRPYRPYLLRIARNLMVDRVRAQAAGRDQGQQGVGDIEQLLEKNLELPAEPPEQIMHQRRLAEATAEFLAGQDEQTQNFVKLRFEEDLSQDEVAEALRCTRRRVRTLEGRVQAGLRKHLSRKGLLR